jgi:glycine hydroxymethyltransferase
MQSDNSFFFQDLVSGDSEIYDAVSKELVRQQEQIELIASENIVSKAVLQAQGSIMTNKYAEGYPGKRYYGGCEFVDIAENLAIERVTKLFNCKFANVQPNSGSQANQGVFQALLKPGDTIMGMSLAAGGHLTHGAQPNQSGKWFNSIQYGVDKHTHLLDYDEIELKATESSPSLIIAGGSAYPRHIDFKRFREIADKVGAFLLVDMAHFSGLVAAGNYPTPLPHAHVVTSTTHKTLRGPRGGIILTNDEVLAKKINSAIFPGIQGGPLMHVIAAKAVAFKEALDDSFTVYANAIVDNAKSLSDSLKNRGCNIISGGTDSHLILVDLRPKGVTGKEAEISLERAGITCNKNGIPFDPEKPAITSGIRLGTPAATTRGFGVDEFTLIGNFISEVLDGMKSKSSTQEEVELDVRLKVRELCQEFPIYGAF